jgi:hypothetical protein
MIKTTRSLEWKHAMSLVWTEYLPAGYLHPLSVWSLHCVDAADVLLNIVVCACASATRPYKINKRTAERLTFRCPSFPQSLFKFSPHVNEVKRQPGSHRVTNKLTTVLIGLYNKDQHDALFTFSFIPINNLYMFRAGLLLIIRRYYFVYAVISTLHALMSTGC